MNLFTFVVSIIQDTGDMERFLRGERVRQEVAGNAVSTALFFRHRVIMNDHHRENKLITGGNLPVDGRAAVRERVSRWPIRQAAEVSQRNFQLPDFAQNRRLRGTTDVSHIRWLEKTIIRASRCLDFEVT